VKGVVFNLLADALVRRLELRISGCLLQEGGFTSLANYPEMSEFLAGAGRHET
jgi:hypothetical protein